MARVQFPLGTQVPVRVQTAPPTAGTGIGVRDDTHRDISKMFEFPYKNV